MGNLRKRKNAIKMYRVRHPNPKQHLFYLTAKSLELANEYIEHLDQREYLSVEEMSEEAAKKVKATMTKTLERDSLLLRCINITKANEAGLSPRENKILEDYIKKTKKKVEGLKIYLISISDFKY